MGGITMSFTLPGRLPRRFRSVLIALQVFLRLLQRLIVEPVSEAGGSPSDVETTSWTPRNVR